MALSIMKKFFICIIFSLTLFILVWLSEILRYITMAVASGWTSGIPWLMAYSALIFFLFVFVIVPSVVLAMWMINPYVVKKLLSTFELSEELLEKKPKETKPSQL